MSDKTTDTLGPDERAKLDSLLDHIHEYGTTAEGVLRLAAQLCESARAAERERCADACRDVARGMEAQQEGGYSVAEFCALRIEGKA